MPKQKSAIDHLDSGRQPHIVHVIPPGAPGCHEAAGGEMVVSSPAEVDGFVRRQQPGEVATLDDLRAAIAARHGVAVACPVSTAIFLNMAPAPPRNAAPWESRPRTSHPGGGG